MSTTHPDFAGIDVASLSHAETLAHLEANAAAPIRLLNGRILDFHSARGICRYRFEIVPAFCHSQGRICQGGLLTSMVDIAMANAAIAKSGFAAEVPTLELKVSFLEAVGPGHVVAEGRVLRWGRSIGFLDGELRDEQDRLVVHATSTVRIVRPRSEEHRPRHET